MLKNSRNKAFTLKEQLMVMFVLILLAIVFGGFFFGGGVLMANYWVSEESALKAVQAVEPSATKVITLNRDVWAYSKVLVRDSDGYQREFYLNANILQSVTAIPVIDLATQSQNEES